MLRVRVHLDCEQSLSFPRVAISLRCERRIQEQKPTSFHVYKTQHVTVIFSFQKLMFTLKGHLFSSKTNLFFSLFQTLPDFGFLRGIILGLFGASCVVVAAILFHVVINARVSDSGRST